MDRKEITGENKGGVNIKQPLLRCTCQGAVIVKASPAVHCTFPDPRPVKCAMLHQMGVFLCPVPWSQICQLSAIADHTTSAPMGCCASLDSFCVPSQFLIHQKRKLDNWWRLTLNIVYQLNSLRVRVINVVVIYVCLGSGVWTAVTDFHHHSFYPPLPKSLSSPLPVFSCQHFPTQVER